MYDLHKKCGAEIIFNSTIARFVFFHYTKE